LLVRPARIAKRYAPVTMVRERVAHLLPSTWKRVSQKVRNADK
jgi:hypothetical protein